jgi:EAL domain-containing protein (putative c-di-GMP-specific phosphodiesterase class I)
MFPLDLLKIDCSIIANAGRGHQSMALVQTVVQLGRSLGISVIAEGVETEEQLKMLQLLKCQFGQGFLFSKPLRLEQAMEFRVAQCNFSAEQFARAV